MPQMMPMNWIMMFTFFTTIILLTMIMLFSSNTPLMKTSKKTVNTNHQWSW